MNQDPSNLNQNNFNINGNNGMPNNQPLNNQNIGVNPQQTPNFQQSVMQEPIPQPMNTFESGNVNNQNFNSKPPKKINIGLIIGIVAVVAVVGIGIVFGSKLLSNNSGDGNSNNLNNGNNSSVEQENNNSLENGEQKVLKASSYFDVSKFDKTKYNGFLYGYDGSYYKVTDFINNIGYNYDYNNQINVIVDYLRYAFSSNYESEKEAWNSSGPNSSDAYINKIIEVLGQPSTYCEKYYEGDNGITGKFVLVYNYGDYLITFPGLDMRNWNEYNYKYPQIVGSWIYKTDDFYSDRNYGTKINEYTCYGEQLKRN